MKLKFAQHVYIYMYFLRYAFACYHPHIHSHKAINLGKHNIYNTPALGVCIIATRRFQAPDDIILIVTPRASASKAHSSRDQPVYPPT